MADTPPVRVMRTFTRGLRIPKKIGRLYDGTRLPGGPYTFAQFITGAGAVVIGYFTLPFWAQTLPSLSVISSEMVGHILLLPIGWGVAWLAGLIPADVNPLYAVQGITSGARPSRFGRMAERAVPPMPGPRRYRARVRIDGQWVAAPAIAPEAAEQAAASLEVDEPRASATGLPVNTPQRGARPSLATFRAAIVKE